jgi:uridine kinase
MVKKIGGERTSMMCIGICGASGSGKSTLAEELRQRVAAGTLIINQDAYYRDHPDLPFAQRAKLNYDEPGIFDHDLLLADMRALRQGQPITRKGYDYAQHRRADSAAMLTPQEMLIVEGIHVFYDPRLRELFDLKLFMHVEADICLLRRVQRDINERGRAIDNIAAQYLDTVRPMFDRYVRGYIEHADIIVAKGGKNARIVDLLAGYINAGLHNDEEPRTVGT